MLSGSHGSANWYNDSVPREFTRALLVQAQAHGEDVDAKFERHGFLLTPSASAPRLPLSPPNSTAAFASSCYVP